MDICDNSLMVHSHPGSDKTNEETETYFLSNLHQELISKNVVRDKQKTLQSNKPVFLSGGNMRNSLTRWHVVSSRLQLEVQHAVLVLNLHWM